MNVQILIESVVRETMILIAQLATSGGARAPLAEVADQVFLELVRELQTQGVSRKVAADMFGLALRSYRRKIQRVSESETVAGRSLWGAVFDFIRERPVVARSEVEARFHRDDGDLLGGVLQDLSESGLVFRSGIGAHATYRAATDDEMGHAGTVGGPEGLSTLVWALVYREGPITREALAERLGTRAGKLPESLDHLLAASRIRVLPSGQFAAHGLVLPLGSTIGWEAAVFDHVKAMVQTICARLNADPARPGDAVGGSTYTLEVWPDHPLEAEALATLSELRKKLSDLRHRIADYNAAHPLPQRRSRVIVYGGQCVLPFEDEPIGGG